MTAGCAKERIKMMPKLPPLVVVDMEHPHESAGQWLKTLDNRLGEIKKICKEEGFSECAFQIPIDRENCPYVYIDNGDGDELEFDEGFWEFIGINESVLVAVFMIFFDTRSRKGGTWPSSFKELPHIGVYYD
jgi:hypothetical protein